MSRPEFDAVPMSRRDEVQTPPPRGLLPALLPTNSFIVPPAIDTADKNAADKGTGEVIITNQGDMDEGHQPPTGDQDDVDEEVDRIARWLKNIEIETDNRYNRTVIISPLPDTISAADVLPRIRGGVDSCYISKFEGNCVAVVTFKLMADAITYAESCAESPIWGLWNFEMSRPGVPFAWERRAEVKLYKTAPGMGTAWNRRDIPTQHRTGVIAGSRCLVYRNCNPHNVAGIYRALGLHKSQHQRDQVEGMWLDGPVRDGNGNPVRGTLHIWYTSVKAAQEARLRVTGLNFEYDPCSNSAATLLLHLDDGDEVPVFRHHHPFVNLIELDQKCILTGIYEGLVDPIQTYWRCRAPVKPAVPDSTTNLATRLQWSLQNNGVAVEQPFVIPSRIHGPFMLGEPIPPPGQVTDPFVDSRPTGTGAAQHQSQTFNCNIGRLDPNSQYQPFVTTRDVPPDYHLSPVEAFVARAQERRARGCPPYSAVGPNDVVYRPIQASRSLIDVTTDTCDTSRVGSIGHSTARPSSAISGASTVKKYPMGDDTQTDPTDAPQEIQAPGDSAFLNVQETFLISDSPPSSYSPGHRCAASPQLAPTTVDRGNNDHDPGENGRRSGGSGNVSDSSTETVTLTLRGGGLPTKADTCEPINDHLEPGLTTAHGRYSRKELHTQDAFWTCTLNEFHAMSDTQWASFGTTFYVAPEGFDTATKHVVRLE